MVVDSLAQSKQICRCGTLESPTLAPSVHHFAPRPSSPPCWGGVASVAHVALEPLSLLDTVGFGGLKAPDSELRKALLVQNRSNPPDLNSDEQQ